MSPDRAALLDMLAGGPLSWAEIRSRLCIPPRRIASDLRALRIAGAVVAEPGPLSMWARSHIGGSGLLYRLADV